MKNIFRSVQDKPKGKSEKKEALSVDRNFHAEDSKEKEIVKILSNKLGITEDELRTYIVEL